MAIAVAAVANDDAPQIAGEFIVLDPREVVIGERLRPIDLVWAGGLGQSMRRDGQIHAIEVCRVAGVWHLAGPGGHRLPNMIARSWSQAHRKPICSPTSPRPSIARSSKARAWKRSARTSRRRWSETTGTAGPVRTRRAAGRGARARSTGPTRSPATRPVAAPSWRRRASRCGSICMGSILASVLGGVVGSMFEGPTRSGYSAIGTDAAGNATSAISGGRNSEGRQRESLTYADAVLDGLAKIAGGLGGRLGSGLDLGTIGTQNDKYVFDPDGAGSAAGSKFDTLEAAVQAALSSAIGKGAVTGLSDAVRKALGSSSDVDKALAEAMGVKQLETLLGGVGGQLDVLFREFDNVAAERVRLAKSYGLDLLAVEKKNAEERAALLDETLKSRVGSLQDILDDMRYGDLFEGDASERRSQILGEIEDAKQDATAGVDGAADRLAELYRLLLDTTRENFGTAGSQLTSDRGLVSSGAADIIKRETDRLNAAAGAQKATTDAIMATNKLVDEGNDLAAVTNARVAELSEQMAVLIEKLPANFDSNPIRTFRFPEQ